MAPFSLSAEIRESVKASMEDCPLDMMASIFSVVGGPTIISRGQSSMLALTLSLISKEREKGAIPDFRIESYSVSRAANICLSLDANAIFACCCYLGDSYHY